MVNTAVFHARVWRSFPGLGGLKEAKNMLPHPLVKLSIGGNLLDRVVACSASDLQGLNFEFCVWRAVSSHHPQEVLLAQFSLYVNKSGIKPDLFHFYLVPSCGSYQNLSVMLINPSSANDSRFQTFFRLALNG